MKPEGKGKNVVSARFTRTKENFICENCGEQNNGTGYTNHCGKCLWSKHVDVFPGDRQAGCGGLMEPVSVSRKSKEWRIFHRCVKCGFERWQTTGKDDNWDALVRLAQSN